MRKFEQELVVLNKVCAYVYVSDGHTSCVSAWCSGQHASLDSCSIAFDPRRRLNFSNIVVPRVVHCYFCFRHSKTSTRY